MVHEIRNYPYPQLHLLALQGLNTSRHATAVRESYEVWLALSKTHVHSDSVIRVLLWSDLPRTVVIILMMMLRDVNVPGLALTSEEQVVIAPPLVTICEKGPV